MLSNFDPLYFGVMAVVMVLAIGLHEFCHAKFADLAGDPTPRAMGRVTLNPLRHLDPIGSLCFVISSISGVGIGWGKPVMVDPRKMRNPRWDHFISVAAGPLSNLLQSVFFALILRVAMAGGGMNETSIVQVLLRHSRDPMQIFLVYGVLLNLGLFFFNLIPIGPLDGHWLIGAFLPDRERFYWYRFNRGMGMIVFLILVLIPAGSQADILGRYFAPLVFKVFFFFTGMSR